MKISNLFSRGIKTMRGALSENSQTILIITSITGSLGACVLTARATFKAADKIKDEELRLGRPLTKEEKVAICWKYYIPAAASWGISSGSAIAGVTIANRKSAALAAALDVANQAANEKTDNKDISETKQTTTKKAGRVSDNIGYSEVYEFIEPTFSKHFRASLVQLSDGERDFLANSSDSRLFDSTSSYGTLAELMSCMGIEEEDIPEEADKYQFFDIPYIDFGEAYVKDGHVAIELKYNTKPEYVPN